ncbi:hypothetical protein D3C74_309140 [compost metagenome]
MLAPDLARQVHAAGGVRQDPAVVDRVVEQGRQGAVGARDRRGAVGSAQLGDPRLDSGAPDLGDRDAPPPGRDVEAPRALDRSGGRRLEVRLALEPRSPELEDRRPGRRGVDELAAQHRDLERGREGLGAPLGLEAPLLGLLTFGGAVANHVPPSGGRLVGLNGRHDRPPAARRLPGASHDEPYRDRGIDDYPDRPAAIPGWRARLASAYRSGLGVEEDCSPISQPGQGVAHL